MQGSLPCEVIVVPKNPPLLPDAYELHWTLKIDEPKQDRNIVIGWRDTQHWAGFHLFDNRVWYEKHIGDTAYSFPQSSILFSFKKNTEYRVRTVVHVPAKSIELWIDDQRVMSFQEPASTPQLSALIPVLRGSTGEVRQSSVLFTHFSVSSTTQGTALPLPPLKQTDPQWADKEYDHAIEWSSEPTMQRWGCALTSAVMVLRFHGIRHLPDGTGLWPDTLNTWLSAQPDGFFLGGHVNWRALTRLSVETNRTFNTTKLEFSYEQPVEKLAWIENMLKQAKPIILEQPGHFVTALSTGPSNFVGIRDPYYDREDLSAYNNTYLSARVFTPSNTDLRAFTIIAPLSSTVHIWKDSQEILGFREVLRPLVDPIDGRPSSLPFQLIDVHQPDPGEYTFSITSSQGESTPYQIYMYSKAGTVQSQRGWSRSVGDDEIRLNVTQEDVSSPSSPHTLEDPLNVLTFEHPQDFLLQKAWESLQRCRALFGTTCNKGWHLFLLHAQKHRWLNPWSAQAFDVME